MKAYIEKPRLLRLHTTRPSADLTLRPSPRFGVDGDGGGFCVESKISDWGGGWMRAVVRELVLSI